MDSFSQPIQGDGAALWRRIALGGLFLLMTLAGPDFTRAAAVDTATALAPAATAADAAATNNSATSAPAATAGTHATSAPSASASHTGLQPFQASYAWQWHGATVALSTVTLTHQDGDTWVYSSSSEPRGLGRLYPMHPTQRSVLRVTATGVEPQSYRASAGTSSTSRDADVTFDWAHEHASGVYDDVKVDMPIKPGVQDDLSVQIAMMVQLLAGRTPTGISVIDKNTVRAYSYTREGTATIDTPFGPVRTVIYASHHAGSPRITRFWCDPSRNYLPMRVQQKRLDSVEWTMDIQSAKIDASP